MSTNFVINGTAISHVPGAEIISLAPNQTYFATYELASNLGNNNEGTALFQFELNGNIVGGTQSSSNLVGLNVNNPDAIRQTLSSSAVITTGAGVSDLTLVNNSGHAVTMEGANINIVKIE
ncbi:MULTISPECIES: hypothetical protein [Bacillus cereus group]|uniref:hypothetical protein n=1 Tax=Bacillus cereus group TaxID=86661 RepID=UPI00211E9765|nr:MULTISPECIES: hypothetical protein [Bacillus cereus group]